MLRRTLLKLVGVTSAGATLGLDHEVLKAVDGIRRRMDSTMVSATVSPAMLDQWEEVTSSFGRQYSNTPPLRLLCDVLLEFSAVREAMEHRQPSDLQERLFRMAAKLSGLSGMIMINLGDHRLARSFFRTGRTAADETGDRALRAWVTAREALVPLYYGDPQEALSLAKKSKDLAGKTPCAAQAMAPVVEARALSMMHGTGKKDVVDQAKRALTRARDAFQQMNAEAQGDIAFGYTERQLYFHQGDALVRLGQSLEADVVLEKALARYQPSEWLDPLLIRFDRATCRLLEGDIDEACRLGKEAFENLEEKYVTADIVRNRALDLIRAAEARGGTSSPALRELKEAVLGAAAGGSDET